MNNFAALKTGQWVKIKGMAENSDFIAHKVKIRRAGQHEVIEGKLQDICLQNRAVTVMNISLQLEAEVAVQGIAAQKTGLPSLRIGEIIKLKGRYCRQAGFKPEKLKLQEPEGIHYPELQGYITALDQNAKILEVVGVRVTLRENTKIEGF